jgi:putative transposase
VERLIATIRLEYLDHILFWNAVDLERKLTAFRAYYNEYRVHSSLGGHTPAHFTCERVNRQAALGHFHWQTHCHGIYQLPVAA